LFFYLFIIARIFRLIVKFHYGDPDIGGTLEGEAFILESLYTIISYIGVFFLYFGFERSFLKKTHYFFSILTIIVTILSIIDFLTRSLTTITIILFIGLNLGIPLIYLYIAIKGSGNVRQKAIYVFIAYWCFAFSIAMDIPDGKVIFGFLPLEFLILFPPFIQIISFFFFRAGFRSDKELKKKNE
jgi:hypothetical protein